jgi:hypothetical protein
VRKEDYQSNLRRWIRFRTKLDGMKQPIYKSARLVLALHLEAVQEAKRQQLNLTADCRKATRELNQKLAATRTLVSRIHHLLKATLGPRDERLIDLGVPFDGPALKKARSAEAAKAAPPATTPTAKS